MTSSGKLKAMGNHAYQRHVERNMSCFVTGLCEGNSPVTAEFLAQRVSNAENVSIGDVIMLREENDQDTMQTFHRK